MKAAIHGFESLAYLGPKYGRLHHNFKRIDSLKNFKNAIKKWKPELYPCRLYKIYIQNLECL